MTLCCLLLACKSERPPVDSDPGTPPATETDDTDDTNSPSPAGTWVLSAPPAATGGTFVSMSPEVTLHLHLDGDQARLSMLIPDFAREKAVWADVDVQVGPDTIQVPAVTFQDLQGSDSDVSIAAFELTRASGTLTGTTQITASLTWPEGIDTVSFTGVFTGGPDTTAALAYEAPFTRTQVLPWTRPFRFRAGEPIPGLQSVVATLDGSPAQATLAPGGPPDAPLLVDVEPGWMPWGSELDLAVDGLTDLAGNPVAAPTGVQVDPAPPAWNGADGFEAGLDSWRASAAVDAGPFGDVAPPEGAAVAFVPDGQYLVGAFDVGATDTSLSFQAALAGSPAFCSVWLRSPSQEVAYQDALDTTPLTCTGCPTNINTVTAFETVEADLVPFRGETVVVHAFCEVRFGPIGPYGLLLDSFSVQ